MENSINVLYDNYVIQWNEWYEEFKDYCEDNDIDHTQYDDNSEYFMNWVYDTLNMYWDDFICNLQHDKDNNVDCVVVYDLGLWNGRKKGVVHCPTLESAIYSCIKDCDYITITLVDGVIKIRASHHDGTNYFEIHKLNERGYDAKCDEDNDLNNEKYFDKFCIQY